ncbi:MAG: MopE-related protein [Myxococcota bacterium]
MSFRATSCSLLLALSACHSPCERPWYADLDGDGFGDPDDVQQACERPEAYVALPTDCDDRAPEVHPEAIDACNGVDDDCDGTVDPAAARWFVDADHDGIGTADDSVRACDPPTGYVDLAGDCDDTDPNVFPNAPFETCDGIDQDCDGLIDEGALSDEMWYPDNDHDGYGLPAGGQPLCAPPSDWVDNGDDCDDFDADRHPGALEACNLIDDDCDDDVDMNDEDGGVLGSFPMFGDGDQDGYGAGEAIVTCTLAAGYSAVAGDCDDDAPQVKPGQSEVCNGVDDDCDLAIDDDDPSLDPTTQVLAWTDDDGDGLGDPLSPAVSCAIGDGTANNGLDCDDGDAEVGADLWLLDDDGDGAGAGTPTPGTSCAAPGGDYVNVSAPLDCDDTDADVSPAALDLCGDGVDQDCTAIDPACGAAPDGVVPLESLGRTYAAAAASGEGFGPTASGDVTGDGAPDLFVGAPTAGFGTVYVFPGPAPELASTPWLAVPLVHNGGGFGSALATVDDATGDGVPELAIGAPSALGGQGRAYVFEGTGVPSVLLTVTGTGGVGSAVTSGHQIGGEAEVLVSSPNTGVVGLLPITLGSVALVDARLVLTGPGGFGATLAAEPGGAVAVGHPEDGGSSGSVYLFDGTQSGLFVSGTAEARWLGAAGDSFGAALAAGGDFDGDGSPDLAATAPGEASNGVDAGAAYVFVDTVDGSSDVAAFVLRGDVAGTGLGASVAFGDLDRDGIDDLVVGAPQADVGGADGGAVYVVFGPAAGVANAITADAILYGAAGARAGEHVSVGEADPDPGDDLLVTLPDAGTGTVWLVPGAP